MDSVPSRSVPVVTRTLILINVVVFFFELALPQETLEQFFYLFGIVPARFAHPNWAARVGFPVNDYWPLLTHQFLHGGWLHIIGNMWTLWIFGDKVEDRTGPLRFLFFYLTCGFMAAGDGNDNTAGIGGPNGGRIGRDRGCTGCVPTVVSDGTPGGVVSRLISAIFLSASSGVVSRGVVCHSVVQRGVGVGQSCARRRYRMVGARWGVYGGAAGVPVVCAAAAPCSADATRRVRHRVDVAPKTLVEKENDNGSHADFLVIFHADGTSAGNRATVARSLA